MNNLRNLKTPVLALIFGLGLVFSQSAFKAASATKEWVRDASGIWHEADTVDGFCLATNDVCSGKFENGVNPNLPISDENPNEYPQPTDPQQGTFAIN